MNEDNSRTQAPQDSRNFPTVCNRLDKIRILLRDSPGPTGVPLAHVPCTFIYTWWDKGKWLCETYPCESDADGLVSFGTQEAGREICIGDCGKLQLLYPGHKVLISPNHFVDSHMAGMLSEIEMKKNVLEWCGYPFFYGKKTLRHLDHWLGYLPEEGWLPWLETRLDEEDLAYFHFDGKSQSTLSSKKYDFLTYSDKGVTAEDKSLHETRKVLKIPRYVPIGEFTTRINADIFWNTPDCFAAPRANNRIIPYRDGEDYMREVAYCILAAQKFIYIADWRINFFVPLIRRGDPELEGEKSSLENLLLKSLADHPDLKVFIMCYDSTPVVDNYEKKITGYLETQSPLKEIYGKRLFFLYNRPEAEWSPHQKLVILDAENTLQAFVGGVDLCDGRWDWHDHALISDKTSDLKVGPSADSPQKNQDRDLFFLEKSFIPGTPYTSPKGEKFYGQNHDFYSPLYGKNQNPQHALHILYLKYKKDFEVIRAIHGEDYDIRKLSTDSFLKQLQRARNLMLEDPKWCNEHWGTSSERLKQLLQDEKDRWRYYGASCEHEELTAHKIYLVPFFPLATNENIELLTKTPHPILYPRMPWHDVACALVGPAAWDVAENFSQRWEKTAKEITQTLIGKINWFGIPVEFQELNLHREVSIPATTIFPTNDNQYRRPDYPARIQIVRSIDNKSLPSGKKEQGIWLAYRQAIKNAIHYIYIESQYFGTEANKLHQDIADRVKSAIDRNETFRVYIILPVFPEEGWKSTGGAGSILYQQNALIKKDGLLYQVGEYLLKKGEGGKTLYDDDNWSAIQRYIGVFSLRSYAKKKIFGHDFEMTERVYVHSKFMLVDDRVMIIGSANINDRSLLGDRDNEIAAIIMGDGVKVTKDGKKTENDSAKIRTDIGTMDGKAYYARDAALQLRRELWLEHLGASNPQALLKDQDPNLLTIINDPVAESTWQFWHSLAAYNTAFYAKKFYGLPAPCRPSGLVQAPQQDPVIPLLGQDPAAAIMGASIVNDNFYKTYDKYMKFVRWDGFAIRYMGEPDSMTDERNAALQNPEFNIFRAVEEEDQKIETLYSEFNKDFLRIFERGALRPQLVYYPLGWMSNTDYFSGIIKESRITA